MQFIRNLIVVAMMMVVVYPAFSQKADTRQPHQDVYAQATDLFQKEKYASAQHLFDKILIDEPNHGEACYYAAVCSGKLNSDDALYRFETFLRLYPESVHCNMARFYEGNFHFSRKNYKEALQCYMKVIPNEVEFGHKNEYEFKTGYCYFMQKNNEKAKSYFSRLITGQSKYTSTALYYYAHIQYMEHEYDLALKNFEKLKDDKMFKNIVPSYVARIYYYLGREDDLLQLAPDLLAQKDAFRRDEIAEMVAEVCFNRGEYKRALEYYYKANDIRGGADFKVACSPQDNYYQIGYCHYMLGEYDKAAKNLSKKTSCVDSVSQNALYTLGDTYVKLGLKNEARSVFLQASTMDFDKKVKEDALFNYAKLSCELNVNPYNESIRSFEDYLTQYPNTEHKTEIQEILTSLYLTTKNYKDVIELLERIPNKNAALNQAYQRCLVNRGIELFNEYKPQEASTFFEKAIQINVVPKVTSDAQYLYGEAQYRMGSFPIAKKAVDKFLLSSNATKSVHYPQALYTAGYLYMKDKQYQYAEECFKKYIATPTGKEKSHQTYDVYNRLGDCRYVAREFDNAIDYYDKVIKANDKDGDYATYQKAMSYGAVGKNPEKLTYLNYIFEKYDNSQLCSKAMLEIANTYLACDNNDMALLYYGNFIKQYPQSAYVKDALLSMGLVYYNTDQGDNALKVFDELLTKYPGTEESRDALSTVKNIYVEQNRVGEYFDYVQRTTNTKISDVEQDSTMYITAETKYQEGDCEHAVKGFENYLNKFPNGLFHVQAHYFLADCLFRGGQEAEALPHYEAVAMLSKNKYTETSLFNSANIAYKLGDYAKAKELYSKLYANSESDNSRLQGRVGVLRCEMSRQDTVNMMAAADALLAEPKVTTELKEEAMMCKARGYYGKGDVDSAKVYYTILSRSSNGEYSGEAYYVRAEIMYLEKKYEAAHKLIENEIINNSHSDYWLAKTFILWADIYAARGNVLQAQQTLQSIIDNYDGADLVKIAMEKRDALEPTTASEQQSEEGENEMIIEMEN